MVGPLDGIRVLDFTRYQQGPAATALLADLGATVLKVEQPAGEPGRTIGIHEDGFSSYFELLNRNKRSVGIDLHHPAGCQLAFRLASMVDVVTENFRTGVMKRYGLDYEDIAAVNPGVIYASASTFGPVGPRVGDPGFDAIGQAVSGTVMWYTREGEAPFNNVQSGIADQTGGLMMTTGILAALLHRSQTGEGQRVETSLYGTQVAIQGIHVIRALHSKPTRPRGRISTSLHHTAMCGDQRWLEFGYLEGRFWGDMCRGLELQDLEHDPRFATSEARGENMVRLLELLDAQLAQRPASEWIERLRAVGVACTVVQDYQMVSEDPQALANDYIHQYEHSVFGTVRTTGTPIRLSKSPAVIRRHAPVQPGESTEEVLREMGVPDDELSSLIDCGAVFTAQ